MEDTIVMVITELCQRCTFPPTRQNFGGDCQITPAKYVSELVPLRFISVQSDELVRQVVVLVGHVADETQDIVATHSTLPANTVYASAIMTILTFGTCCVVEIHT